MKKRIWKKIYTESEKSADNFEERILYFDSVAVRPNYSSQVVTLLHLLNTHTPLEKQMVQLEKAIFKHLSWIVKHFLAWWWEK